MTKSILALLAGTTLLFAASGCSAQSSGEKAGDKAFGERVRAYLLVHPEVIVEATQKLQAREDAATASAARAALAAHRRELEADPRDPIAGAAKGAITVVEFFDYRCPYCKVAGPALPDFLAKHPNVRLVLKEFPILSPESEKAARLALAADRQGKYWPVHQALMKLPVLTDATMETVLRENGVDVPRAKADAAGDTIGKAIDDVHALARALAINGTPTFIVGDSLSAGWLPDDLDANIKTAMKGKTG